MLGDVNLIVVGDSFVYGHLGSDVNKESCHRRSWVSKLGRMGNFKSTTNLGAPGASNARSFRVLLDHIEKTYTPGEKYLVIFCITELLRFELPIALSDVGPSGVTTDYSEFDSNALGVLGIGNWSSVNIFGEPSPHKEKLKEFLDFHYAMFSHAEYYEKIITQQLFMLKSLLDDLNIDCLFASTIAAPEVVRSFKFFGKTLPLIEFENTNIGSFLKASKFQEHPCGHYGDDANEFLANYTYNLLKER